MHGTHLVSPRRFPPKMSEENNENIVDRGCDKNENMLRRVKVRPLSAIVVERRLRLGGHMLRMPSSRHACTACDWIPVGGRRRGRLRII